LQKIKDGKLNFNYSILVPIFNHCFWSRKRSQPVQDNQTYYLGIKAIIQNAQGAVLVLKSAGGHWDLPGGRIQLGEEPLEALLREVKEETGLESLSGIRADVMALTTIAIREPHHPPTGLILWYHTCHLDAASSHVLVLSAEHIDAAWVEPDVAKNLTGLPDTMAPHIFKERP